MKKHLLILALFLLFMTTMILITPRQTAATSYIYTSPRAEAAYVPIGTTIIINYGQPIAKQSLTDKIKVTGAVSGPHSGDTILAADGQTIIFKPHQPFAPQEKVSVVVEPSLKTTAATALAGGSFSFTTSPKVDEAPYRQAAQAVRLESFIPEQVPLAPQGVLTHTVTDHLISIPGDYPPITMTVPATNTDDGFIFMSNFSIDWNTRDFGMSRPYLLILDDSGEPVFYQRMPPPRPALDFKKQPNGLLTYGVWGDKYYVMDDSYTVVDTYVAGNGYMIDLHDLQILDNGHALIMIYDPQPVDMSQVVPGGNPQATVIGLVIQELDTNKEVVFEWRSWDHIPITDSHVNLTAPVVDYIHGNSVAQDSDGHLLISSRSIDEVTKINRQTGDVIWRLGGGLGNEFTFINDNGEAFLEQHDARRLANGNLTIFDNRTSSSTFSRGVEYVLDEVNKTAEPVWEYREAGPSPAMGNMQRLPNGNSLIGWGSRYPSTTEVMPDGNLALSLQFLPYADPAIVRHSYRALRLPWQGFPNTLPHLMAQTISPTELDLIVTWNGATEVASYNIMASDGQGPYTQIGTVAKTSYETRYSVANADAYCQFQVTPVLADASTGPTSNFVFAEHCINSQSFMPVISP